MNIERPDLSQVDATVLAYIEALEAELDRLREAETNATQPSAPAAPLEPSEPPTSLNLITISVAGIAKRTPRHLYYRQRRGGMGIFDLESPESDPPAFLTIADESQNLLLITNHARAFRLPVNELPESPVRSRGQLLTERLPLRPQERLAIILPSQPAGYVALVTERGHVRRLRHHYLGDNLRPGALLFEVQELGAPAAGELRFVHRLVGGAQQGVRVVAVVGSHGNASGDANARRGAGDLARRRREAGALEWASRDGPPLGPRRIARQGRAPGRRAPDGLTDRRCRVAAARRPPWGLARPALPWPRCWSPSRS